MRRHGIATTGALALLLLSSAPSMGHGHGHGEGEAPRAQSQDRRDIARAQGANAAKSRINRCTLRVNAPDASAASRRHEGAFSVSEIADVRFDVFLLESRSSEPAEVRVYAPGDRLFKVLRVQSDPGALPSRRRRGLSRRGLAVLSAQMPLVGTHVTSRSLYGEWRAEARFVDADAPCARSVDFILER